MDYAEPFNPHPTQDMAPLGEALFSALNALLDACIAAKPDQHAGVRLELTAHADLEPLQVVLLLADDYEVMLERAGGRRIA